MKYSHRFIVFIWLLCFCWLPALNAQENTIVDNSDLEDIFQTNKTPIWDYVFLRNTTKEFLETAKSLERDLLSYQDRLANENEKNLILNQAINVANLNVDLAKIGLDYAEQSLSVARQNADIAQTRVRNKFEQANDGRATLNFIKKKHEDIANSGFWSSFAPGAILGGLKIVAGVGALFVPGLQGVGASQITAGATEIGTTAAQSSGNRSNIEDRDAITERQTEDQIRQMQRELIELEQLSELSLEQIVLEEIAGEKAEEELNLAELQRENAVRRLGQYINDRPLNPNEIESIIGEISIILQRYLRYSVILAQLTEKAYQAEEVIRSNYIKSDSNYISSDSIFWLAADRILFDLNTIEFNRITQKKQKPNFLTYTLSLRNKDPFQMERLRQTGRMNFDITQFELDLAFPGTYARTIKRVDVQVVALAEPGGVKGQLTKEGLSWKKVPNAISGDYALDDWFKYLPSEYRSIVFDDANETLIFPRAKGINQTPGLLDILEGRPLSGTYTLELPKYSNNFDYSSLSDVIITIDFASYFDPVHKTMVEAEICEMASTKEFINTRELQLSMRLNQPDDWYEFRNPVEQDTLSHKRRYLPVFVYKDFIRANHIHPKQNSLSVAFLKESGFADMNFSVTSLAMNASYDLVDENGLIDPLHIDTLELNWFEQFSPLINGEAPGDTVFLHTADSLALSQENTNIPETRSQPFEIWLIKLEADRNAPLCLPGQLGTFDPEKLDEILDIQLNLGYVFSSDFCTFSGRRYAWIDVDTAMTVRGYDTLQHQVPFLYVIEQGDTKKKVQDRLTWYDWRTDLSDKSFTLNEFIHKTQFADLIPFYSFLGPKTDLEEIEIKFDLKNAGDQTILYCEPSWIKIRARKPSRNRVELEFLLDESAIPTLLNENGVTLTEPGKIFRFDGIPADLKFRYLVAPGGKRIGKLDIFVAQYSEDGGKTYYRILETGARFRAFRQPFQTHFTLRIDREDYPEKKDQPSFILKDLQFKDLSRF